MSEEKLANHIMLDLETLGTASNSMLLQVSMVSFRLTHGKGWVNSELISVFDEYPSLEDQDKAGANIDDSTVAWWEKTNPMKFTELMNRPRISLADFRTKFEKFIRSCGSNAKVWAKSPSFDCNMISSLWPLFYQAQHPWKYWNEMDVRTICSMFNIAGDYGSTESGKSLWLPELNGKDKHDALYDCFVQVNCVIEGHKMMVGVSRPQKAE
jgi:hypothetical protein